MLWACGISDYKLLTKIDTARKSSVWLFFRIFVVSIFLLFAHFSASLLLLLQMCKRPSVLRVCPWVCCKHTAYFGVERARNTGHKYQLSCGNISIIRQSTTAKKLLRASLLHHLSQISKRWSGAFLRRVTGDGSALAPTCTPPASKHGQCSSRQEKR